MRFLAVILILLMVGCSSKITQKDLDHLNGYWEIEKVIFPDGSSKSYRINETVDFIELTKNEGYRKKVRPRLNGTYEVSADAEPFIVLGREGVFSIRYSNELSEWEEQIKYIGEDKFSVVNQENITYHYKRYKPLLEQK